MKSARRLGFRHRARRLRWRGFAASGEAGDDGGVERNLVFASFAERLGEGAGTCAGLTIGTHGRGIGSRQSRSDNGFANPPVASKAMVTGLRAASLAAVPAVQAVLERLGSSSKRKFLHPRGQSATSSLFFETSIPTNAGCALVSIRPLLVKRARLRPWRLFGLNGCAAEDPC